MIKDKRKDKIEPSFLTVFIGFLTIACIFFAIDLMDGLILVGDIDDQMRRIQIKDLLSDNQWHDLTIPGIAMPEAYISPWSRLVDAPYVFLTKGLSIFMPEAQALKVSMFVIPPLLLTAFSYFLIKIIHAITPRPVHPIIWGVTIIACFFAIIQFSPTRVDHHNIQFIYLLMMLWGAFKTAKFTGYLSGLAIVLSISTGLEFSPIL